MSRGEILVGATIVAVRALTKEEARELGWSLASWESPVVLEVETESGDTVHLYPMRDPEGNGPGALLVEADRAAFLIFPETT